ncbi:MAG: nickel pincer cofactor biosynthesis protein LarC [Magnetococcales bacterium]|nr:nickel pincer cofactor biosynthesis protein LarC [Magnetococcales bacterium]
MNIHLDLHSGIAGDMFMAACLDLGLDQGKLEQALATIELPGWSLKVTREKRGGMAGVYAEVIEDSLSHHHDHHHLDEILHQIDASGLPDPVKDRAKAIFTLLAEAEGKVHGLLPNQVHFHEVGAVDAIVDICAAAFAHWSLGMVEISASPVVLGTGSVHCQHGQMPVPVPAVAEIVRRYKIPINHDAVEGEMVTPTGAAILANMVTRFGPSRLEAIHAIGVGLGSREVVGRANALRILAQRDHETMQEKTQKEWIGVLTTHIDDMNPEWYGLLWERLFEAGALDVAMMPITMKKGRPATRLEVMVPDGQEQKFGEMILTETSAIGVRMDRVERLVLPRTLCCVETPWGSLQAKRSGEKLKVEYQDLAELARRQNWSLYETSRRIQPYLTLQLDPDG